MKAELTELERVQNRLLQRLSALEHSLLPQNDVVIPLPDSTESKDTESRLSAILQSHGVTDFAFKRVLSDYYEWPLEARRDVLGAASVDHLCKSIVLYIARFNGEAVKNFLYALNDGKIAKKKFNMRLAPEETSAELTGYGHNAVTCFGLKTQIPVILDEAITRQPCFLLVGWWRNRFEARDKDC